MCFHFLPYSRTRFVQRSPRYLLPSDAGQAVIDELHGKSKGVVCYISIGTVEDWRDDAKEFPSSAIGGDVSGWAGEKWVDVNDQDVREIMTARVEMASNMNCDAVVSTSNDRLFELEPRSNGIFPILQCRGYEKWVLAPVKTWDLCTGRFVFRKRCRHAHIL